MDVEQFWFNFRSVFTNNPDVKVVNDFVNQLLELIDRVKRLEAVVFAEPPVRIENKRRSKRVEETFYTGKEKSVP